MKNLKNIVLTGALALVSNYALSQQKVIYAENKHSSSLTAGGESAIASISDNFDGDKENIFDYIVGIKRPKFSEARLYHFRNGEEMNSDNYFAVIPSQENGGFELVKGDFDSDGDMDFYVLAMRPKFSQLRKYNFENDGAGNFSITDKYNIKKNN